MLRSTHVPFDRHLPHERLFALHSAAIAHRLERRQEVLLEGVSEAFIAALPDEGPPIERLLSTLHRLNAVEKLKDGSVPLAAWLGNALALTKDDAFEIGLAAKTTKSKTDRPAAVDDVPDDPRAEQIRALYEERTARDERGEPVSEILAEIVRIKREVAAGPELAAGTLLSGARYKLISHLGRGGIGDVWKAFDHVGKRHVAIKFLLPEHGPSVLARFRRGARCMAALDHPNVVRVLQTEGVEERDGVTRWFFVMEYLPGGTLKEAVANRWLIGEEALSRVIEAGRGLAEAHRRGMTHRDVTPDNILITANGVAKLTDFDLVRAEDTTGLTRSGHVMGKFFYLAPELFDGVKEADAQSEVYSLGMTAIFTQHGKPLPHKVLSNRERFLQQLSCDEAIKQVLSRATAVEAEERYGGVEALCLALAWAIESAKSQEDVSLTVTAPDAPNAKRRREIERLSNPWTPEAERIAIAEELGRGVDPRLTQESRWIDVPAGPSWRGALDHDGNAVEQERPGGLVYVSSFKVARWPVIVAEYLRFMGPGKGYSTRAFWSDEGWAWREDHDVMEPEQWANQCKGPSNVPVTGVSWWESEAYCRWATAAISGAPGGWVIRLPTEAEWEKAARGGGSERRIYPWGDKWEPARANTHARIRGVTPVGCFPEGSGPYGAWDQAGNVWEWCLDYFDPAMYHRPLERNPWLLSAADAPLLDAYDPRRGEGLVARCHSVRGGAWSSGLALVVRVSYRGGIEPWGRANDVGFRCVMARRPDDL